MPFTLAHPIASYLFKFGITRNYLSLTGLILGCMAPDFEYFLRMRMYGEWGHQWSGIVLLDLPVALILALLIHCIIRDPVIQHLPLALKQRFSIYAEQVVPITQWRYYLVLCMSIILGALTHIVWDSFTHVSGYFVERYAVFRHQLTILNHPVYVYKLLQHGSSLLGLGLIALYVYRLPRDDVNATPRQQMLQFYLALFVSFICMMWAWAYLNPALRVHIVHVVVASIACAFYSTAVVAVYFHFFQGQQKRAP